MTTGIGNSVQCHDITSGTKEWADHNINCIYGCYNNCRYCYARMMAKRFGRSDDDSWKDMKINPNALNKKYGRFKGRVMFPSTHDIVNEVTIIEACCTVIKKLLNAGNQLLITTKPDPQVIDILMERFESYKEQIQFRFTITSLNNRLLKFWEPNAPSFDNRFIALKTSYEAGFKTSVSVEPFLDEVPQDLISEVFPYITESIWVGPMNYIPKRIINDGYTKEYNDIKRISSYNNLLKIYEDLIDTPLIRFKDSMLNRLGL